MGSRWRYRYVAITPYSIGGFQGLACTFLWARLYFFTGSHFTSTQKFTRRWKPMGSHRSEHKTKSAQLAGPTFSQHFPTQVSPHYIQLYPIYYGLNFQFLWWNQMEKLKISYLFSKNSVASLCAFLTIQEYEIFQTFMTSEHSKMHFIALKIQSNCTKKGHRLFMKMQHTYFSSHRRWYRSRSIRKNCWFLSWQVDEPLWSLNDIVLSPAKDKIYFIISQEILIST